MISRWQISRCAVGRCVLLTVCRGWVNLKPKIWVWYKETFVQPHVLTVYSCSGCGNTRFQREPCPKRQKADVSVRLEQSLCMQRGRQRTEPNIFFHFLKVWNGGRTECMMDLQSSWRTTVVAVKQSQVRGRVEMGLSSCLSSSTVSPPLTSPAALFRALGAFPNSPLLSVTTAASAEKVGCAMVSRVRARSPAASATDLIMVSRWVWEG